MSNPPALAEGPLTGDVADLLGSLRDSGTFDSSGRFTMDLAKSRDKLSAFQVDEPRCYVHFLVSAACAQGASYIQFEISSRDVVACFDGKPFSYEDLANLFQILFEAHVPLEKRGSHHLAFALNVARQIGARFIALESSGANETSRIQLNHSGLLQVGRLPSQPWADDRIISRFHLQEPFDLIAAGRLAQRFLTGAGTHWPEQEQLTSGRCGFAPLDIWINGSLLRTSLDAVLEYWSADGGRKPGGIPRDLAAVARQGSGGVGLVRGAQGCVHWVVDGISYREALPFLPEEIAFWIVCDEVKTDLSRIALVQGPDLEARRSALREFLPELLPRLQQQLSQHPTLLKRFKGFG